MRAVTLTLDEMHYACAHGVWRRMQKLAGNRGDREQKECSSWDNEMEGAAAELAYCKMRGIFWTGGTEIRARDGGLVDVRWTKHYGKGGLIVYSRDRDDTVMVLADGNMPTIRFIGWITVGEARARAGDTSFGKLLPREALYTKGFE